MSALQIAWFALIGVLLAGYVILDGYDLGIGFWHMLSRSKDEHQSLRAAIAPYWDANEVWLITAGGALFAAFPMVYATVFSGFYLALMLVVFALIFRAVSIEFVSHAGSTNARRRWELAFGLSSSLAALLFGVAMGNVLRGLPLDSHGNYTGTFFDLLNPYSLLIGVTGFALFALHGALFAQMMAAADAKRRIMWSWVAFVGLLLTSAGASLAAAPHLFANYSHHPELWALPALTLLLVIGVMALLLRAKAAAAFVCSSASIAFVFATLAAGLFPNFVPAQTGTSLTLANSSSSSLTLAIMLGVAGVGMAIVLGYTIWVRRMFAGEHVDY